MMTEEERAEIDRKVIEAIKSGATKFGDILVETRVASRNRVDRALQRLRARGEIKFQAGRWKIPGAKQED